MEPQTRLPPLHASAFSMQLDAAKAGSDAEWIDLSHSDPTRVGLFDCGSMEEALASCCKPSSTYQAEAGGRLSTREALCCHLKRVADVRVADVRVEPCQLYMTTSTSEGYSYIFKALCEVGDSIACPQPSYPLIDYLARAEGLGVLHYALYESGGDWQLDYVGVERVLAQGVKVLVCVVPNNPTGSGISAAEWRQLLGLCGAYGVTLVVDQVFSSFAFTSAGLELPLQQVQIGLRGLLGEGKALPSVLVLDGLSKYGAMPQAKVGWIVLLGARDALLEIRRALVWVGDLYLSICGTAIRNAGASRLNSTSIPLS